jgi:hypothetical protein
MLEEKMLDEKMLEEKTLEDTKKQLTDDLLGMRNATQT